MTPVVEADGLSFGFGRDRPVLREVSFKVGEGECLAIVGPNGAGKSTLLWCLAGLLKARGSLRLFGQPPSRVARARIGLVFQNPEDQLFMPTLVDDLTLPLLNAGAERRQARERALAALGAVGLEHRAGLCANRLSLGERKRAAIACTLVTSPDLLLLDEPTAELDGRSVRQLGDLLGAMKITRIIASHHLDFVGRLAQRALLLVDGAIAADRRAAQLLADAPQLERAGLI